MKKLYILITMVLAGIQAHSQGTQVGDVNSPIYHYNGNVGVGLSVPESKLHVKADDLGFWVSRETYLSTGSIVGIDLRQLTHNGAFRTGGAIKSISVNTYTGGIGSTYDSDLALYSVGDGNLIEGLRIDDNGNVGIGTSNPDYNLHVKSTNSISEVRSETYGHYAKMGANGAGGYLGASNGNGDLTINIRGYGDAFFNAGNVGIGTTTPDYKLDVLGTIRANEVKVATGWSDFVFAPDYDLKSLDQVEDFITENGHLPDIPSAKEVEENGISLGDMDAKLLQKIEELTLYVIELKKENEVLKIENENMKESITEIKNQLR
ncbi:MAG: bZIP transcription factor [Cytophagales bacterium]|nr:bZIP transcription factor [Cytophagales bacterium]